MSPRSSSWSLTRTALGFAAAALLPLSLLAQDNSQDNALANVGPSTRITAPISNDKLVTLKGNTPAFAQSRYDQGAVSTGTATGTMTLLLRRSPAQETALITYLGALQNPHDPSYHKWLTPESFGSRFGASAKDIQTVSAWLQSQGFKLEGVSTSLNMVRFSGTTGQVSNAFHTAIHAYSVGGAKHMANATDPQIPAALAPVVQALSPLNDKRAKPLHVRGNRVTGTYAKGRIQVAGNADNARPNLTLQDSSGANILYVTPQDAAAIYDLPNELNQNFSSGSGATRLTGQGVNIGLVGYSDLQVSDYNNYRSLFLGTGFTSQFTQVIDGTDPGVVPGDDGVEALLDAQNAAALAPDANIYFYSSAGSAFDDGLFNASLRAVSDNTVSVLSVSYGNCEANLGQDGNQQWATLWQQAAAQGITVTVSTGDSGSASCDDGAVQQNGEPETAATMGLSISGLASTPYNVAVGGTDFYALSTDFTQYVSTSQTSLGSALGYIPENPWNDGITNNPPAAYSTNTAYTDPTSNATILSAGGGGPSTAAFCSTSAPLDANSGECISILTGAAVNPSVGYPKPSFQQSSAFSSTPLGASNARSIPDVSLFAGPGYHSATWAICLDPTLDSTLTSPDCVETSQGTYFDGIGGTSAASPAFAGMLASVIQSLGAGQRLGLANNVLYNLAATPTQYSAAFHDVTAGNNSVPCVGGSPNCGSNSFINGYNAGTNYDYATGLGSVDVSALVKAWPAAQFTPTSVTLSANGGTSPISVVHGTAVTLGTQITPGSASGSVGVIATLGTNNAVSVESIPLTNGSGSISAVDLPGGNYTIYGQYLGDATYAPSTSTPPIQVTISSEPSTTEFTVAAFDASTQQQLNGSTVAYGQYIQIAAEPVTKTGTTGHGVATGPVTLQNNGATFALPQGLTNPQPIDSNGIATFQLTELAPGTYNFSAAYGGDSSYQASVSQAIPFAVTKAGTTLTAKTSATSIAVANTVTITVTLASDSVGAQPTGAITLTSGGTPFKGTLTQGISTVGTIQDTETFVIQGSQLAAGSNTLTASYQGDGNYGGSTSNAITVNVTGGTGTSPAFSFGTPPAINVASSGASGTGQVTLSSVNSFAGAVNLGCQVAFSALGNAPTCSVNPTSVTLAANGTGTATVTVNTTALSSAALPGKNDLPLRRILGGGGSVALGVLVLCGIPARRRSWRTMLLMLCSLGIFGGVIGCGSSSGSGSNVGTPAGTYTLTVTGTATSAATENTQITVTVQ